MKIESTEQLETLVKALNEARKADMISALSVELDRLKRHVSEFESALEHAKAHPSSVLPHTCGLKNAQACLSNMIEKASNVELDGFDVYLALKAKDLIGA